jgi:cytosine/adenosine deaminase-related metal-dependent hydrolase
MRPVTITGARIYTGNYDGERFIVRDLHISRGRMVEKPPRGAVNIDLSGCAILPALVNAHDHLELNHYPRTKYRERYDNAHQWGEDVNEHLNDSLFRRLRAYPLWDRLFIGGLKNLLCGALTVAHHNPPHRELFRRDYPVRVLQRYGWTHSLHFSTDAEVVRAYRRTPPDVPFFIHLAEGTDKIAGGEYQRLNALGCVGSNTVIIHGVDGMAYRRRDCVGGKRFASDGCGGFTGRD